MRPDNMLTDKRKDSSPTPKRDSAPISTGPACNGTKDLKSEVHTAPIDNPNERISTKSMQAYCSIRDPHTAASARHRQQVMLKRPT